MAQPPMPAPGAERDPLAEEIEMKLRGVDGGVRVALVKQINKLVEKNPQAFVSNMRNWMNQGRHDD